MVAHINRDNPINIIVVFLKLLLFYFIKLKLRNKDGIGRHETTERGPAVYRDRVVHIVVE